ncbi:MAG: putative HTH-type transcriptional regulator [Methanonatronarchaeales archaeon]|nr:putative HTH-type transcriptional regulator [Methanonatronarchaeales archaeon]
MELDRTDIQILRALAEDGRISYREIAEMTGVTPPTVKSRIDSLVEEGVIEGFTVVLDEEALVGEGKVVNAQVEVGCGTESVDDVFSELAESEHAKTVLKTADSKVLVRYTGDSGGLKELLSDIPEGATGYRTVLITEERVRGPRLPS